MGTIWSIVSLSVRSNSLHPDRITEIMGLAPTDAIAKGQVHPDRPHHSPKKVHIWSWDCPLPRETDLHEQISHCLHACNNVDTAELNKVADQLEISFFCSTWHSKLQSGVTIDPELIKGMAKLNAQLDISIYFSDELE